MSQPHLRAEIAPRPDIETDRHGTGNAPPRPARPPSPRIPAIPAELRDRPQWVVWRYERRDGRWTKVPYQPRHPGRKARADVPATWATFDEAWSAYESGGFDGIGYEFAKDDPFYGSDLDNCLRSGEVMEWAAPILAKIEGTYGEVSPSGNGIKFVALGQLSADKGTRKAGLGPDGTGALELYDHGRFFTITGNAWDDSGIVDRQSAADELYAIARAKPEKPAGPKKGRTPRAAGSSNGVHDDREVLRAASSSDGFDALYRGDLAGYPSPSEADLGLMNRLAFYAGPRGHDQVVRLFLGSGLGERDKAGREDYVARTAAKAYEGRTDYFGWGPRLNGRPGGDGQHADRRPGFSNCRKVETKDDKGEARTELEPRAATEIADYLEKITGAKGIWPKRLEEILFVQGAGFRPVFLDGSSQLFGWLDGFTSVFWARGADMVTQERFYEYFRKFRAGRFRAIERFPHFPPMPETYYMHPTIRDTRSRTLIGEFLGFFDFAGDVDESLAETLLLTLFWGGTPGARPCYLIRGPEDDDPSLMGRYVGKTTFAEVFAGLVGGLVDLLEGEDLPAVKTRLLSDEGMSRRMLRIDNVKTVRLSWAALEGFITSDVISGKRLFRGEGSRPNTVTVVITMNGGSLSKDMATRVVAIRLARPTPSDSWRKDVAAWIEEHRWALIAEIRGRLADERGSIVPRGRWAEWQGDVLGKVKGYEECQRAIGARSEELDSDDEAAQAFEALIRENLMGCGHAPADEFIKIKSTVMGVWYSRIHKAHVAPKTATERLQLMPLKRLRYRRTEGERFWQWSGESAKGDPSKPIELKSESWTLTATQGVLWGE